MNARVTTLKIKPGMIDDAVKIFQESIVPTAWPKGFVDAMLLKNLNKNELTTLTIWENEETMIASETLGFYQEQISKMRDVVSEPPMKELTEVAVPLEALSKAGVR